MHRLGQLAGLAVLLASFGCQRTALVKVPIEGMKIPREYPASVEVSNWNGNVQVYANDKYGEPEVRAKARALDTAAAGNLENLQTAVKIRAVSSEEFGKRVFRVTGTIVGSNPAIALDLQIRIPRAWGVRVVNAGGEVEIVGAGGPVTVENGSPGRPGGDIQFRSGIPITDAVAMTTSEGHVLYQVGPGSTGDIDLQAFDGTPEVDATSGSLQGITFTANHWRGTLDKGTNQIRLRSDKGDVRMLVIENAGTYGRQYWDGWPEWPTHPKWMAKLAGE